MGKGLPGSRLADRRAISPGVDRCNTLTQVSFSQGVVCVHSVYLGSQLIFRIYFFSLRRGTTIMYLGDT